MKAPDLRIGNIVYNCSLFNKEYYEITPRFFAQIAGWKSWEEQKKDGKEELNNSIQPIPLTEEWLEKLGFIRDNELKRYHKDNISFFDDGDFCIGKHIVNNKPEYVHSLQNIYYSLYNQELTLTIK